MPLLQGKTALVTGASSGFGEAVARALAREKADLALGARRSDRLERLAKELQAAHGVKVFFRPLDVRETPGVESFVREAAAALGRIDILVNNAGLALGKKNIADADEKDWIQMVETNLIGVFRMTKAVLPFMSPEKGGHIVNIGSVAGHYPYEGGGGYCASKFGLDAMTKILRLEILERGIKVSSVDPGMAETEFSVVRFGGNEGKAKEVYDGMTPLRAADIAESVLFVLTRPAHVNIDQIILTPLDQGTVFKVRRKG